MKPVFADAAYFLALLNPDDEAHTAARSLSEEAHGNLVTTEFVLTEVGDAMSGPRNRPQFARFLALLRGRADTEIVKASGELFQAGCELHAARPDKEWSLTDCTSFVIME